MMDKHNHQESVGIVACVFVWVLRMMGRGRPGHSFEMHCHW